MHNYKAKLIKIVDADTVDLDVDLGFHVHIRERFRLAGIDAWETRGSEREKGLVAKEWLRERLEGRGIEVKVMKNKGKYGRWICYLSTPPNEPPDTRRCINDELVDEGHAVYKKY